MLDRLLPAALVAVAVLLPLIAYAQDKAKSPLDYSLRHYSVMLSVALLGGVVAWWSKVRAGLIPKWSINHLVGELCTSAFAGLLAFWLCEWASFPPLLTAALTGISGHMGTRAVTMFESFAERKFGALVPPKD